MKKLFFSLVLLFSPITSSAMLINSLIKTISIPKYTTTAIQHPFNNQFKQPFFTKFHYSQFTQEEIEGCADHISQQVSNGNTNVKAYLNLSQSASRQEVITATRNLMAKMPENTFAITLIVTALKNALKDEGFGSICKIQPENKPIQPHFDLQTFKPNHEDIEAYYKYILQLERTGTPSLANALNMSSNSTYAQLMKASRTLDEKFYNNCNANTDEGRFKKSLLMCHYIFDFLEEVQKTATDEYIKELNKQENSSQPF